VPDCAHANPLLKEASEKYTSPGPHDFPLPFHNWSFDAAVDARWFDTKSKEMGDDYRDYIFANQISINTRGDLTQYTESFAKSRELALPFAIDPQGKLAAEVKGDYALGQRVGIEHTPTIWVVTANSKGAPFVEGRRPQQAVPTHRPGTRRHARTLGGSSRISENAAHASRVRRFAFQLLQAAWRFTSMSTI